jgi:hypothetical protein
MSNIKLTIIPNTTLHSLADLVNLLALRFSAVELGRDEDTLKAIRVRLCENCIVLELPLLGTGDSRFFDALVTTTLSTWEEMR